jgi:hypothetical protein
MIGDSDGRYYVEETDVAQVPASSRPRTFRPKRGNCRLLETMISMQIILELPEDIAERLKSRWKDLPRAALESLALEAYRCQALTTAQLRGLLGLETQMRVDAFLKEHEVYDVTVADFDQDRETLRQLRTREAQV